MLQKKPIKIWAVNVENIVVSKLVETELILYLKTRHIFKSFNIYLKPERFRKSKFTLSKVKSEKLKSKFQNNIYKHLHYNQ